MSTPSASLTARTTTVCPSSRASRWQRPSCGAWFSLLAWAFQPGLDLLLRMKVFFSGICDAVGANPASPANPGRIDKRKPIWTPFMDDMKRSGPLTLLP